MQFDFQAMAPAARYEMLLGSVAPRPIAIVVSLAADGTLNAAPYSLFNVISHDPPIMVISVLAHPDRRLKDTARNVVATKDFSVNLVSEALADAMNLTCIDAPPETSEIALAGLPVAESVRIKAPRLATSPVAFECALKTTLSFGDDQLVVFGEVLTAHIDDRLVSDAERGILDTPAFGPIGAMHGARWYTRTSNLFAMDRPSWAEWTRDGKS